MFDWQAEALVPFDELMLPEDADEELMRDFTNPALIPKSSLLLYGPPGTGKSALCKAIAAERTGAKSLKELDELTHIYDLKDRKVAQSISQDLLMNTVNLGRFYEHGHIFIFDELDELTEGQMKELTAFINSYNRLGEGGAIFATTNVDVDDRTSLRKMGVAGGALLDRFEYKELMDHQHLKDFLPLIHRKLMEHDIQIDDADILTLAAAENLEPFSRVSIRQVRAFVLKIGRQIVKERKRSSLAYSS